MARVIDESFDSNYSDGWPEIIKVEGSQVEVYTRDSNIYIEKINGKNS